MKFAVYARRSEEKDTGESIKNQLKICTNYIQLKFGDNAKIDQYFDDDCTGKNTKRPDFMKMMRLIRGGVYDYLAFWKLDRVSRNSCEFLNLYNELEKLNVNLISYTENFDPSTSSGKMMMTMLISVAEMERKNISLRVTSFMRESAKMGKWNGGIPPIGYKSYKVVEGGIKTTYLTTNENIEIAKYIFENYKETNSFRATSRNLKDKYNIYKTPVDIKRLLINPIYVKSSERIKVYFEKQGFKVFGEMNGKGMLCYGKEDTTSDDGSREKRANEDCIVSVGKHEGIISDTNFIKTYELVKKAKIGKPITSKNTYLNPLVYCSICGGRMRTKITKNRGKEYLYFTCNEKDTHNSNCNNRSVYIRECENDVLNKLEYIYLHKDEFKSKTKTTSDIKLKCDKLTRQLNVKEKEIKNLIRKSAQNEDLKDDYADVIRDLKSEKNEIEIEIEECKNQIILDGMAEINKGTTIENLKDIKKTISRAKDIEAKEKIIKSIVKRIDINGIDKTIEVELCI